MIYIISDGHFFCRETWKLVVKELYSLSFDDFSKGKKEYMENVKKRIKILHNKYIISERFQEFCEGLDKLGLITIIRCKMCEHNVGVCMVGLPLTDQNLVGCTMMDNEDIRSLKGGRL
jgi:hypothetical protein